MVLQAYRLAGPAWQLSISEVDEFREGGDAPLQFHFPGLDYNHWVRRVPTKGPLVFELGSSRFRQTYQRQLAEIVHAAALVAEHSRVAYAVGPIAEAG